MNNVKMLERKVNLLIDYVTCPEADFECKESLLLDLKDLKSEVSACSAKVVTENLLTELGVPSHLLGYDYTVTAVKLILEDPSHKNYITGTLYPKIAEVHSGTTPSRVERAIHHAIEVFCERGDISTIHKFFGNTMSTCKGKPTNSEFLCRLAQLVEREMV